MLSTRNPRRHRQGGTTTDGLSATEALPGPGAADDNTVPEQLSVLAAVAVERPASGRPKKRVQWSTITVYEFGVGLGGSAVSERGGPPIGLAEKPEFTWTTKVGEMAECSEGIHRFTPDQRTRLLRAAGVSDGIISRYARETNIIIRSRRRTVADQCDESSDEDEDESDDDSSEDEYEAVSRKRKAEALQPTYLSHPPFMPMRRPRMIPANYV